MKRTLPQADVPQQSPAERARKLIFDQRYETLRRYAHFRSLGYLPTAASRAAGSSRPTIWRYENAVSKYQLDGLWPKTARCGRKSELKKFNVPKARLCHVERLALQRDCSIPAAWRLFAASKDCPPGLAARLRKSIPPSFVQATPLKAVAVRVGKHVSPRESLAAALKTRKEK